MNQFAASALKTAQVQQDNVRTTNGMLALASTSNSNLDFFSKSGERFKPEYIVLFEKAFKENHALALSNLLHSRDIRGGKGIRDTTQKVLEWLADNQPDVIIKTDFLQKLVDVGYWKDLFGLVEREKTNIRIKQFIIHRIAKGLKDPEVNKLLAKWLPLKGNVASMLRSYLHVTPKEFRQMIVELRKDVTERFMCENRWGKIPYGHVPSKCMHKNKDSFAKHDGERFGDFISAVNNGTEILHSATLFPHEVSEPYIRSNGVNATAEAQWSSLPNYVTGSHSILPVVDLSGSMLAGSGHKSYSYMHIAITLGAYISERVEGPFKNLVTTFASKPCFIDLNKATTLAERYRQIASGNVGYSTNLKGVYELILNTAIANNIPQSEMPEAVMFLSDTQSNFTAEDVRAYDLAKIMFHKAGYKAPRILFWVLNAQNNVPVRFDDNGAAIVNGFSQSLLKALLSTDLEQYTPLNVMLEALSDPRYQITFYP